MAQVKVMQLSARLSETSGEENNNNRHVKMPFPDKKRQLAQKTGTKR